MTLTLCLSTSFPCLASSTSSLRADVSESLTIGFSRLFSEYISTSFSSCTSTLISGVKMDPGADFRLDLDGEMEIRQKYIFSKFDEPGEEGADIYIST